MKGILMRYLKFLPIFLAVGAFITLAHSQDDNILLNHRDVGAHQRPLVKFNHKLHAEDKLDCSRCHHDFDQFMNNKGAEGQTCDSCHKNRAEGDQPSIKDAFHLQCKGCHEKMKTGPVTCGECHARN